MRKTAIENAERMLAELDRKESPEYGMTEIGGCRLTRSDCDMLRFVAGRICRCGGEYPSDMMEQYGEIRDVLAAYGLPYAPESWFF